MWEVILRGGVMMIPLFICSIVGITIIFERLYSLRQKKIVKSEIINLIENINASEDISLAKSICKENPGTFSNIVQVGLDNIHLQRDDIRQLIEDQGRQEVRILSRGLVTLETIAGISPLLGLLGTVLGMIRVFDVISLEGVGGAAKLSAGISEALITTVTGLSIGIFALVFYNFFSSKAEAIVLDIEKYSSNLIQRIKKFSDREAKRSSASL